MSTDFEDILRPVDTPLPNFPAKYITLANGQNLIIRQAEREDMPALLPHVEPLIHYDKDFYNLVAARLYAELL